MRIDLVSSYEPTREEKIEHIKWQLHKGSMPIEYQIRTEKWVKKHWGYVIPKIVL